MGKFAPILFDRPDIELGDARGQETVHADAVTDMLYKDAQGRYLPKRVHVPGLLIAPPFMEESDAPVQWYRGEGLYVERRMPAKPSSELLIGMQMRGWYADFPNLVTLTPHLAAV